MIRRREHRPRRTGSMLVEAALVLPIVIMFILGIFEYGRYMMTVQLYNNAVRSGAAYAAKHTSPIVLDGSTKTNTDAAVTSVVNTCLCGASLTGQAISVYLSDGAGNPSPSGQAANYWTNAQAGQYVCVKITGTYRFAVTGLIGLPASVAVTYKAIKRSEGN